MHAGVAPTQDRRISGVYLQLVSLGFFCTDQNPSMVVQSLEIGGTPACSAALQEGGVGRGVLLQR